MTNLAPTPADLAAGWYSARIVDAAVHDDHGSVISLRLSLAVGVEVMIHLPLEPKVGQPRVLSRFLCEAGLATMDNVGALLGCEVLAHLAKATPMDGLPRHVAVDLRPATAVFDVLTQA